VVNFRILPGDTVASVIEHVHATIDDQDVTVRRVGNEPSDPTPVSDSQAESFTALRKTIHQVFPDVVVAPGLVIGRTDSRRYVKVAENSYRFLPMRLGREDLKRIHGTDERISVNNYLEIVRFYIQLLRNIDTVG
jgi:carboxypeptidase PM20D1